MTPSAKLRLALVLAALFGALLPLAPSSPAGAEAAGGSYQLDHFPYPSGIPGIEFADYSAISNSAHLASGFTSPDFDTVGVIELGNQKRVFRVGAPFEDYCWYWGINNQLTTVGFRTADPGRTVAWMRAKDGGVETYSHPAADIFLYRLNDQDAAVGEIVYTRRFWRPVIADRHGFRVVDPPGVGPAAATYFADNNNTGAIVGGTRDPVTFEHTCLLWDRGGVTPITHEGASLVAPRAINNHGQVAGYWLESAIDPVLGDHREHGFIREPTGEFRTVDVEYPWPATIDFPEEGAVLVLVGQTTEILDLNDRGQIVIQATGWYDWDGFILPTWTYALGTPVR